MIGSRITGDATGQGHRMTGPEQGIAVRLRAARTQAGLTQQQVARKLGLSRSTVSRLENGHVIARAEVVHGWAEVTGADEHWLRTGGVVVQAQAALAVAAVMAVGWRVGYIRGWDSASNPEERVTSVLAYQGRWLEQWWTLVRSVRAVRAYYAGSLPGGNYLGVHFFELGCLASQWLQEHLEREGLQTDADAVDRERLMLAADYANTHKHAADKAEVGHRVGRILEVVSDPRTGQRITVVYAQLGQKREPQRLDALRLLEACEGVWRTILGEQGLEPTDPPEDGLVPLAPA